MKHIHFPTLIMHAALLLLAGLTLDHYPDFFLGAGILVLLIHAGWVLVTRQNVLLSHCIGAGLYFLAEPLGIITITGGFYGMGSEFGWLFYGFALAASVALEVLIAIFRRPSPRA